MLWLCKVWGLKISEHCKVVSTTAVICLILRYPIQKKGFLILDHWQVYSSLVFLPHKKDFWGQFAIFKKVSCPNVSKEMRVSNSDILFPALLQRSELAILVQKWLYDNLCAYYSKYCAISDIFCAATATIAALDF